MKRKLCMLAVLAGFSLATLPGCGFVADGPFGWAYTNSKTPVTVGKAKSGSLKGKACIHSYFGLFTIGDANIESAMKAGGITEVYLVDKENLSIFGTYTRQCTVVTGEAVPSAEAAPAGKAAPAGEAAPAGKAAPAGEAAPAGKAAPAGEAVPSK
jgi:hypothetical protein